MARRLRSKRRTSAVHAAWSPSRRQVNDPPRPASCACDSGPSVRSGTARDVGLESRITLGVGVGVIDGPPRVLRPATVHGLGATGHGEQAGEDAGALLLVGVQLVLVLLWRSGRFGEGHGGHRVQRHAAGSTPSGRRLGRESLRRVARVESRRWPAAAWCRSAVNDFASAWRGRSSAMDASTSAARNVGCIWPSLRGLRGGMVLGAVVHQGAA